MIKVLFLIHDLGPGGAEKVLINLLNNMDPFRFDITLLSLFDVGVNRQFIGKHVTYKSIFKKMFRGNVTLMKLFSPKLLHRLFIHEKYDIEISYLEGVCARIISGCIDSSVRLVTWIHIQQPKDRKAGCFRTYEEAVRCYGQFDRIYCVSESVRETFCSRYPLNVPAKVMYNTLETEDICRLAEDEANEIVQSEPVKIIAVGKLIHNKGFDRLLPIIARLKKEGVKAHLYILGKGEAENQLRAYVLDNQIEDRVTFLGYQTNPYKYIKKCDLFVCASLQEGFSTAASEALILGIPVLSVEVGGMREMLGKNNEYGVVVPNSDENLYFALKELIQNPMKLGHYRQQAIKRGELFKKDVTVRAVENELEELAYSAKR